MRTPRRTAVPAVLLLLAACTAAAQYRGEERVEAVIVPVTVRTASGRLVDSVAASRFHLFVDGMEIPITDLHRESDLPLSLGFILDTSGSMAGHKMASCRQLVLAFLDARQDRDELALWTFGNGRVLERFPFGTGWYLLPRVLESVKPWGTTALYDMLRRVPEVTARARHPRRAVILLTDGVDNASRLTPAEAAELARHLRTPIYVLGVEPPPRAAAPGGPTYEEILRLIAEDSGGRYQRIPSTEKMPAVVQDLLRELSSRFIISFTTSGVGRRTWRSIVVRVEGYQATTRKGYLGTLP